MENEQNDTLYVNSDKIFLQSLSEEKQSVHSKNWCFDHSGIPSYKIYNSNQNNCCTCFDCCTWCLEFKFSKPFLCVKDTNCYICCCAIYFT